MYKLIITVVCVALLAACQPVAVENTETVCKETLSNNGAEVTYCGAKTDTLVIIDINIK